MFIDEAKIYIKSGDGGDGMVAFRHEKYIPKGGPSGGDGGRGGDVVFVADQNLWTLVNFRYKKKFEADNGGAGRNKNQFGKNAEDIVIKVPMGTLIYDADMGDLLADIVEDGQRFVAARGGRGGHGNNFFKSSTNQTPRESEPGGLGQEKTLKLELKLIAHVGLVGFPNAGKSTLLAAISEARPKIAAYPFTTLQPNLGVVKIDETRSFVVADIPGLIEGAHEGVGLGDKFLRHIERNKILLHMVDVAAVDGRDPLDDFKKINSELKNYGGALEKIPQIVALNKADIMTDEEIVNSVRADIIKLGYSNVHLISAATRKGIDKLIDDIWKEINA